jgi:hypothetical protein
MKEASKKITLLMPPQVIYDIVKNSSNDLRTNLPEIKKIPGTVVIEDIPNVKIVQGAHYFGTGTWEEYYFRPLSDSVTEVTIKIKTPTIMGKSGLNVGWVSIISVLKAAERAFNSH